MIGAGVTRGRHIGHRIFESQNQSKSKHRTFILFLILLVNAVDFTRGNSSFSQKGKIEDSSLVFKGDIYEPLA
jgi:hypothetical protein